MKVYMVVVDTIGHEPIDKKVFLHRSDAEANLKQVIKNHESFCKQYGYNSYEHRFDIAEYDLVGALE
jgi:hypothetical protein